MNICPRGRLFIFILIFISKSVNSQAVCYDSPSPRIREQDHISTHLQGGHPRAQGWETPEMKVCFRKTKNPRANLRERTTKESFFRQEPTVSSQVTVGFYITFGNTYAGSTVHNPLNIPIPLSRPRSFTSLGNTKITLKI